MPNHPYQEEQDKASSQNTQNNQYNQYNYYNYQDNRNRNDRHGPKYKEYRKGDGPTQIPWWIIIVGFCIGLWPLSVAAIVINSMARSGSIDLDKAGKKIKGEFKNATSTHYAPNSTDIPYAAPGQTQAAGKGQATPQYAAPQPAQGAERDRAKNRTGTLKTDNKEWLETFLLILGIVFVAGGVLTVAEALPGLAYSWSLYLEDLVTGLILSGVGGGMIFSHFKLKTSRRTRKKIVNIVGNADSMYISDIASATSTNFAKCCTQLEDCINAGVFGEGAYLDMRSRALVVRGKAPQAANAAAPKAEPTVGEAHSNEDYAKTLAKLRSLNDSIDDPAMTEKITRLETVSSKIFKQAEENPDKLPQMRRFMDYYLPTSLKLLETYAELDAQGIEGDNISDSKHRIEQAMDMVVGAFETQLDKLFQSDALDVSSDIDVMENMLRADGLADDPFAGTPTPTAPTGPKLEL